ncbi:uncharacterized protein L969DRAFT_96354 [Mixia osmundae IAM 14324]|uniref:Auxin efflux carrier n=1 Tax=Mixia osmundae (strain CBS 9802 / IAM 14324 / JCM 22182 / KY 12970) TaxID=764103 RepID=G7DUZ2_MIXOS|nr:uncharacterized protein L969DRAFT_96354 [Mixia osmundae IAM 14324]KEI37266.1 hypothetical protein L969DRAFT_96354 [Mixia osmundae IAM 14324]GAA94402.1 hypothetical protein E5Q_01054 [Mixia osmundae IAM 14324]
MLDSATAGLGETALSAFEASISVLLTLLYGYLAGMFGMMTEETVHQTSKMCTTLFLPFLAICSIGPNINLETIVKLWPLIAWSFISIGFGFLFGYIGHRLIRLPGWAVAACGLCNANAMPLLLLQSLETTGLLDKLLWADETTPQALKRGKSYVLLNSVVQQALAFSAGLWAMRLDADERGKNDIDILGRNGSGPARHHIVQDEAHVGLLDPRTSFGSDDEAIAYEAHAQITSLAIATENKWKLELPEAITKPCRTAASYLNPPIVGAASAVILGLTPPLHQVLFSTDGALHTSLFQSWNNLGDLFTALQMFVLGAQLYQNQRSARPGLWPSLFVLTFRFILMPAFSLSIITLLTTRQIIQGDQLMSFIMMLVPCGPSALLLANLATITGQDAGVVAGFLALSYALSPLIAVVVAAAVKILESIDA